MKPKAYFRAYTYVAQVPKDQSMLGFAYATPKVLKMSNLGLQNIDVFEYHEGFAGQILANLKAMDSDYFCTQVLGGKEKTGSVSVEKMNNWGGSLGIGHPHAATDVRLAMHTANRLIKEDGKYGLIASAGTGLGVGMIIERHPDGKV